MKILVVGAGSIGKRHAANLVQLGCRISLLPYSRFMREQWGSRPEDLRRFDGAVVATATQHRLETILRLAAAALPLYIEKPLCASMADVELIAECTEHVAARCMVGFMMRYHPAFCEFAAMDLSSVYSCNFEIGHDVRQWRENWAFSKSYAARADSGGALLDLCHELDMALCLFPGASDLTVESLGHSRFPGVDFSTRIAFSGECSPLGIVAMDYLSPVSFRRMTLRGTDMNAEFDFIAGKGAVMRGIESRPVEFAIERNRLFLSAMQDFLSLASGRTAPISSHCPTLDRVMGNCAKIAAAREARRFKGMIAGDFP